MMNEKRIEEKKPEEMSVETWDKLGEMMDIFGELETRVRKLVSMQTSGKYYEGQIETPVINTYDTSHTLIKFSFKKSRYSKWEHVDYGYIDRLTGEYVPGECNAFENAADLFRVEYKLSGSSEDSGTGWETNDKLKEISAKSARDAVKISLNMGTPRDANYRVFEIAYNNSGNLEMIPGAMMFYPDDFDYWEW